MRSLKILLLLFFSSSLLAQEQSIFSEMLTDDVVKATLTTDLKQLINNKFDETYLPGTFEYTLANGSTLKWDVEVRTRGNSRKKICYYPPMKIKFNKESVLNKGYKKHKTYKLVNCCKNANSSEEYLTKEYISYKLYNVVSDACFRAQIMQISYEDVNGKVKPYTRRAFLIENDDELAERLDGEMYEPTFIKKSIISKDHLNLFNVFQYMIGNTDWAITNKHNMKFIRTNNKLILPIAYDFDYSGLVDAYYAVPHESIPISDVSTRYNKGACMTTEEALELCSLFKSKKEELFAVMKKATADEKMYKKMSKYLEGFFKLIENEKRASLIFAEDCLKSSSD